MSKTRKNLLIAFGSPEDEGNRHNFSFLVRRVPVLAILTLTGDKDSIRVALVDLGGSDGALSVTEPVTGRRLVDLGRPSVDSSSARVGAARAAINRHIVARFGGPSAAIKAIREAIDSKAFPWLNPEWL